jgi:hypothetical protein
MSTKLKIFSSIALVILVLGAAAFVLHDKVGAAVLCSDYAVANPPGTSSGSGYGHCTGPALSLQEVDIQIMNCSTGRAVNVAKATFCYNSNTCSGTSNSFTRVSGQTYYTAVSYYPYVSNKNYNAYDTSSCR